MFSLDDGTIGVMSIQEVVGLYMTRQSQNQM